MDFEWGGKKIGIKTKVFFQWNYLGYSVGKYPKPN
jgi:hypothetical protein